MYTGISSTFGNSVARWYRPDLNGLRKRLGGARSFGKDDQRKPVLQRIAQRLQRVGVRVVAGTVDHHHVQFVPGDRAADARPVPVILRGHRSRIRAQRRRQRGPQHHGVHVARVIGEVDALRGGRRGADPARVRADQQAHQPDDGQQELQDGLPGWPLCTGRGRCYGCNYAESGRVPRQRSTRTAFCGRRVACAPGALKRISCNDTRPWLAGVLLGRRRAARRAAHDRRRAAPDD